jgi:TatD DNase family protein
MNAPPPALVDSHAHLDMPEFDADREEVVRRAAAEGVTTVLCPAELTSATSLPETLALVEAHPRFLAAAGVHPHEAKAWGDGPAAALRGLGASGRIAAVGEIGLDFHYNLSPPAAQRRALRDQLLLAGEIGLPAIVHSRLAGIEVVAAVRAAGFVRGGVLHCFTEDWDTASAMMDLGFLISFSGILTFPGAGGLREIARRVPVDRLLVETDSPFLAPVPHRAKKRNEPAFVVATARVLAGLKDLTYEALAEATTANFEALFAPARLRRP